GGLGDARQDGRLRLGHGSEGQAGRVRGGGQVGRPGGRQGGGRQGPRRLPDRQERRRRQHHGAPPRPRRDLAGLGPHPLHLRQDDHRLARQEPHHFQWHGRRADRGGHQERRQGGGQEDRHQGGPGGQVGGGRDDLAQADQDRAAGPVGPERHRL